MKCSDLCCQFGYGDRDLNYGIRSKDVMTNFDGEESNSTALGQETPYPLGLAAQKFWLLGTELLLGKP